MWACALILAPVLTGAWSAIGADAYELGPDSVSRGPGVPVGRVERFDFAESKVFEGTSRAGWVYLPAQYDGSQPAALMVFQDGHSYVSTNGALRAPVVLDNLIARGEMPVTIGVFINPGHRGEGGPAADGWGNRSNRAVEYDSLGDAYVRFLVDELLPWVAKRWDLKISSDPKLRGICGQSSGGICAWTAAWERPDQFGKVLSHIGSFVNIRGGHVYPALIRKTPRKDIRVFLQDGSNDLNNEHGNWPLANLEMASSLAFAGYDHRFVFGDGAHNAKHGGAILPDSLRWLWRDVAPKPAVPPPTPAASVAALGNAADAWEQVGEGYSFTDAACADREGNVYFADLPKGTLHRVKAGAAKAELWLSDLPKVSGMKFGPDGGLYACVQGEGTNNVKRVVRIDPGTRRVETLATTVQPNDLVVARSGHLYFTDTGAGQVIRVPLAARGMSRPAPVAGGINKPNGIALSPDESRLWVSEYGGTRTWEYVLEPDGSLRGGERRAVLAVPEGKPDSGGDGAATDAAGRVFVTSHLGVQVFDSVGRLIMTLPRPQEKATVSCAVGGAGREFLYVCSSDRVYRRRLAMP